MGSALSQPVELVRVQRRGSKTFKAGVAEMQGWRVHHEDAHEILLDDAAGGFWVLDGHGGEGAARYAAPALAREIASAVAESKDGLPSDIRLQDGFVTVDAALHRYVLNNPDKDSGSTVVGVAVRQDENGTYSAKVMNCGDSRALVVWAPSEKEVHKKHVPVGIPEHLAKLAKDPEAVSRGDTMEAVCWPLIAETVDHKPSHPTEKARIQAAGGTVSEDDPPRLDGNLAVSRCVGDFEYKSDNCRPPSEQKCSCVPDVYEVSGLVPGTLLVLACDGIWDVMTGHQVASIVRDKLASDPEADLGDLAATIARLSVMRNSSDNITCMVVQLTDGSAWGDEPDEIQNFEKMEMMGEREFDDDTRKHYQTFVQNASFNVHPQPCQVCNRWLQEMNMCPCTQALYCTKQCQKKGWKSHRSICRHAAAAAAT